MFNKRLEYDTSELSKGILHVILTTKKGNTEEYMRVFSLQKDEISLFAHKILRLIGEEERDTEEAVQHMKCIVGQIQDHIQGMVNNGK